MSTLTNRGLAWNQEPGERRRLLVIASVLLPLFLVMAVYVTWVTLPEQAREEREALPPQLAKLILEKKEPPKPVVKKEEKKPEPEPKKPEPEVAEKPKPKPEPKPVQVKPTPKPQVAKKPEPAPEEVQKAREKAKTSGVLAMSSQLSQLSAMAETVKLDKPKTVTDQPIARKSNDKLAAQATRTTRSQGVDEAQLSQKTEQVALASRQRAEVQQSESVVAAVEAEERKQTSRSQETQRSREELRRTMDANKSAIYSIYNRALRKKPSLQGQITPELVIESNGVVSNCSVVDSTLNEPALEQKICSRLRLVNFGARPGVDRTTIRYPIELLSG